MNEKCNLPHPLAKQSCWYGTKPDDGRHTVLMWRSIWNGSSNSTIAWSEWMRAKWGKKLLSTLIISWIAHIGVVLVLQNHKLSFGHWNSDGRKYAKRPVLDMVAVLLLFVYPIHQREFSSLWQSLQIYANTQIVSTNWTEKVAKCAQCENVVYLFTQWNPVRIALGWINEPPQIHWSSSILIIATVHGNSPNPASLS